jgi:2-polyprenyl-6-methoxyphenol hydroxylase-like FAD-dependent oxidoreductase
MLLARAGLRVLVVDRGQYGTDTLSTHALMRGGVLQLHRWGLLAEVIAAGTPPVRDTTFHYGADALTIPIAARQGIDALYAPRRHLLDRLLADSALRAGAHIDYGVRVIDLVRESDGRVAGVVVVDPSGQSRRINADLVVGADGLRSTVARLAGAEIYRAAMHTTAVAYAYWADSGGASGYHWYWADRTAAGAIPTNGNERCVFLSLPADSYARTFAAGIEAGYRTMLTAAFPELAAGLPARPLRMQTFSGQLGFMRQSWGPGWALVGDAGYFKDPLTAHGLTDGLRDAELLARAILEGHESAFQEYQSQRDELSATLFDLTDRIASFEWDFDSLRVLHEELAKAMSGEVKAMVLATKDSLQPAWRESRPA